LLGLAGHYKYIAELLTEGVPDVVGLVGLVVVVVGPAIVVVDPLTPAHVHALEYLAVPEHGLAYLEQNQHIRTIFPPESKSRETRSPNSSEDQMNNG